MTKVLLISGDVINSKMGGVGVRNWELAHALANNHSVTLAIPDETDLRSAQIELLFFDLEQGDLLSVAQNFDVIILHGAVLHFHPYLCEINKPLAVDLYVPNLLESLVWHDKDDWEEWIPSYEEYLRIQLDLLSAGDFFYCASERQRDYWLGWLHAQKRINPHTYRDDPTLRKLIDVIPFGIPGDSPKLVQPVLKGVIDGIEATDQIILWSGGLWDWLDPLTLIRAVGKISQTHPEVKLYFMGTRHPNPIVTGMSMPERAIQLSQELGLYGRVVFFGEWTTYEERGNYLAEADLAVISHPGHIETRFSFRTRVLDCIWSGLPIITTVGDTMADWVDQYQLGITVPTGNENEMAIAIQAILSKGGRPAYSHKFKELQEKLRWDRVVRPLSKFCESPYLAPDSGKYVTEAERVRQDMDAYIRQVIKEKDEYTERVIMEKDTYLNQVIKDKDAFTDQVIKDKDEYWGSIVDEQKAIVESNNLLLPNKLSRKVKQFFQKPE